MNLDNENIKSIKKILHEIELINLTLNEVEAVENDTCKLELKGKMTFIALEEEEKKDILAKVRTRLEYDKSQLASALGEYVDHSTTDWSEENENAR